MLPAEKHPVLYALRRQNHRLVVEPRKLLESRQKAVTAFRLAGNHAPAFTANQNPEEVVYRWTVGRGLDENRPQLRSANPLGQSVGVGACDCLIVELQNSVRRRSRWNRFRLSEGVEQPHRLASPATYPMTPRSPAAAVE